MPVTTIKITESTYHQLCDEYGGACLSCGELVFEGTEPDACNYKCQHCGQMMVFGAEELVIMDRIEFIEPGILRREVERAGG